MSLLIQPKVRTSTRNGIFWLVKSNMYNGDQQGHFELYPIDPGKIPLNEDLRVSPLYGHVSREPCFGFFFRMSMECLEHVLVMSPY